MESISNFASAYTLLLSLLIATVLTIVALSQQSIRLWLRDFWVTFPWVGTIIQLAKDPTSGNNGWTRAEDKLCSIYKSFIPNILSKSEFAQRLQYINKSTDSGYVPTVLWVWILLILLIIAEGLGFSYLLSTWMASEGSANTLMNFAYTLSIVIGSILAVIMHAAGHQFRRTQLLRSCFKCYKETGGKEYGTSNIQLDQDQSVDDESPEYRQILNRVIDHGQDKGSYTVSYIASLVILVLFAVTFYMRVQHMERELIQETTQQSTEQRANPFDMPLPTDITNQQTQTDDKATKEATSALKSEGVAAFFMLGFIFIITQIVAIGVGYKFGFVGKHSKAAFKATGGFSTYNDYNNHFQPRIDLVNGRLKDLQQRMESNSHVKMTLTKTFYDYLREKAKEEKDQNSQINSERNIATLPQTTIAPSSSSLSAQSVPPVADLEIAKADISRLENKKLQQDYFLALTADMQAELKPWLKQRKEEEAEAARQEAKAREKTELADLF